MVKGIAGSPTDPVPGSASRRIPAFAKTFEDASPDKAVFLPATAQEQQVRAAYIYKADIT